MFIAPPIYVAGDADSEMIHAKQAEMQTALERVRDAAEPWFGLSVQEQDRVREEWSDPRIAARRREDSRPSRAATAGES
jgi:hypothetical protein